jgi:hypothetical protein
MGPCLLCPMEAGESGPRRPADQRRRAGFTEKQLGALFDNEGFGSESVPPHEIELLLRAALPIQLIQFARVSSDPGREIVFAPSTCCWVMYAPPPTSTNSWSKNGEPLPGPVRLVVEELSNLASQQKMMRR